MKKKISDVRRGFTLVELVVTISIFIIISTLVFANYPKFKSQLSLKKTSQEIAFAVREAQVYSLSVKEYNGTFPGYGVHFDISKPDTIILFADVNKNSKYDEFDEGDGIDGKVKEYKIRTSDSFSSLCGNEKSSPPGSCGLSKMDAVYLRPNPLITLKGWDNGGSLLPNFSDVEILISSPGGATKKIIIWVSGQITIE
ncbi:MAG: prepilin-type N-terminal cleavage/methylation domain-containing protein [Candidatus Paceibacterota bacterium]